MKIARQIGLGLVILLLILVVVAFVLPRHATLARSVEIAAPPAAIYPLVGDLRRFNEWSPWFERDPAAVYTFTGPTDGVGQTMNWKSDKPDVGSGSMVIAALDPDKQVTLDIVFAGQGAAVADIRLAPSGAGTTVTWTFDSDLGFNPIARYFGLMMDGMVGPDYEKGLAKLKAVVEAKPAPTT